MSTYQSSPRLSTEAHPRTEKMTSRTLLHVLTTLFIASALAVAGLFVALPAEAAAPPQQGANAKMAPVKPGKFRITQRFHAGHNGIDLAAPAGTPIRANANGRVIKVRKWAYSYGKHVVIQHRGRQTLSAHMSRIHVREGQRVRGGQMIGRVGSTGNSTGPHLHFVVEKGGRAVNPAPYIW